MLAATSTQLLSVAAGVALAVLAALVGLIAARRLRRWARNDDGPAIFTLQDLREMRDRGDITEVEFEAMRGDILAQFKPNDRRAAGGGGDAGTPPPETPAD